MIRCAGNRSWGQCSDQGRLHWEEWRQGYEHQIEVCRGLGIPNSKIQKEESACLFTEWNLYWGRESSKRWYPWPVFQIKPRTSCKCQKHLLEISNIVVLETWIQTALIQCPCRDCGLQRKWGLREETKKKVANEEGQDLYLRSLVIKTRQKEGYLDSVSVSIKQDPSNSLVDTSRSLGIVWLFLQIAHS